MASAPVPPDCEGDCCDDNDLFLKETGQTLPPELGTAALALYGCAGYKKHNICDRPAVNAKTFGDICRKTCNNCVPTPPPTPIAYNGDSGKKFIFMPIPTVEFKDTKGGRCDIDVDQVLCLHQ